MVGRRRELDSFRAWLESARAGAGRLVLCAGEPGIGKTRLAQELAGIALATGTSVVWGRCPEDEGAPAYWPWRQVLRSLGADPDALFVARDASPSERFRLFDDVTEAVLGSAGERGLVVVLDDVHRADEPSLLLLRHLAERINGARLLVVATFREVEPASLLPRVHPDLLRSPAVERLGLRGFDLGEVREQLAGLTGHGTGDDARALLDLTGGNPLFVREAARAMAEGTWQPEHPPRTVLDVVGARLGRLSPGCRRLVQAAAVIGRDVPLALLAATLDEPVARCLPLVDEAVAHGLLDRVGTGEYRFVHALTRDAVEESLPAADRAALHRAVAEATAVQFAGDLSDHLGDIARHWAEVAPHGAAATARGWAARAAEEAVRRLAHEEAVRLYRSALDLDPAAPDEARCELLVALGRAARLAGDLRRCADAAVAAAQAARAARRPDLVAEAALVLEAAPDPVVNAAAVRLCEEAFTALDDAAPASLRARVLAQRSHLAFYDGDQARVESSARAALDLARVSGDDRALVDALHAQKEACPGPAGRAERVLLATEMLAVAARTDGPRTAMWGRLWRIETLVEAGRFTAAADELLALQVAVERVGGPVSAWHLDRATACVAQAQGRYAEAAAVARRGFDRMRPVEPAPATGAYFALLCALTGHVGVGHDAAAFARSAFSGPPRFRTIALLSRAFLLLRAGLPDEAAVSYQRAGPVASWSLPPFFVLPGYVYGALAAAELGRHEDLAELLDRLAPFRGEHVVGEGVAYLGPVELTLGRGAAVLGRVDRAVDDLGAAAARADHAGAPGFVAEAHYHLAAALIARNGRGDRERARRGAHHAARLVRALGMTAYADRAADLVAHVDRAGPQTTLSPRESEVAALVADGLTNRQIAARLVISERTAENHVQHVLTKLGFAGRSQIAAWVVSTRMSGAPDVLGLGGP
jgi:DNA-binding CsgD family transcriptional regulator